VFSVTRLDAQPRREQPSPFDVRLVAMTKDVVTTTGGMRVMPDHSFTDCPPLDILVVPGGWGTRTVMNDDAVLGFIRARSHELETLASVCTGALLIGKAGLLDGLRCTTHWMTLDYMQELLPNVTVDRESHVVDHGSVITSAGISAGIDMALKLVANHLGESIARETAQYMEYPFPESNARRVSF
jgi:transcriptional regulator GlxA family with amidase domain